MSTVRLIVIALGALALSACETPQQRSTTNGPQTGATNAVVQYAVDVEVAADGKSVEIITGSTCKDENDNTVDECVEVREEDYAKFVFDLLELDNNGTEDWYFEGVLICRLKQKKSFKNGCDLRKIDRLDFVATLDAEDSEKIRIPGPKGRIRVQGLKDDPSDPPLTSFTLYDMNNVKRNFKYGIMVCPMAQTPPDPATVDADNEDWSPCLIADPIIRNRGRGRR